MIYRVKNNRRETKDIYIYKFSCDGQVDSLSLFTTVNNLFFHFSCFYTVFTTDSQH